MNIPSCALTEEGLQQQRERMTLLGRRVSGFQRHDDRLTIEFAPDYERGLLDEVLAVERECCPFFRFDVDGERRRLTVSVADPEQRVALDALVHALAPAPPPSP